MTIVSSVTEIITKTVNRKTSAAERKSDIVCALLVNSHVFWIYITNTFFRFASENIIIRHDLFRLNKSFIVASKFIAQRPKKVAHVKVKK